MIWKAKLNNNSKYIIGSVIILFLIGCCCICFFMFNLFGLLVGGLSLTDVNSTDYPSFSTATLSPATMPPPPTEQQESISVLNIRNLENTTVNEFDISDDETKFFGISDVPEYYLDPDAPYDVGDSQNFWIINTDTNENFEADFILRYETQNVYFWVEEGEYYDEDELAELTETFENEIYKNVSDFFGREIFPGIDQDPHIFIIFTSGLGANVGGLFSSIDSIHPFAIAKSNGHETFYINSDNQDLGDEYTYGILAHEYQHMIQWNHDRNETSWLNEGFSELAVLLNGYDPGLFDYLFLLNPDMQLNTWPDDETNAAHYGASLLFVAYFYDHLGEEATKALAVHPDNGLESIDNLMIEMDFLDEDTGEIITADDIVLDWAVTNYLLDSDVGDGRYDYQLYRPNSSASFTLEIEDCALLDETQMVNQYGADYIKIRCEQDQTIIFTGNELVDLLPQKAYSGDYAFWSNQGDESLMSLVRKFDFTEHTGDINFTFKIWYDIEEDYDYLYLVSSIDGENWETVETPIGTDENSVGNNKGWGYNGLSSGEKEWIKEIVDLSEFAGEEVYLGFVYLTDAGVTGEGALIDDVYIPEIDYFEDFEGKAEGWEADGFVLVSQQIPQTYELALIRFGSETSVENLELSEDNKVEFEVSANERVVVVIVGTTRFTHQPAVYNLGIID